MGKYVDGNQTISFDRIGEEWKSRMKEAEEVANNYADSLLAKIKYFRTHSFEEILNDMYQENNEFINSLQEKEKKRYLLEEEEKLRQLDILYDMMPEEQIEKYVSLYALYLYKSILLEEEGFALRAEGKKAPKNSIGIRSWSSVARVIQTTDDVDLIDAIKKATSGALKTGAVGAGIGGAFGFVAGLAVDDSVMMNTLCAAGCLGGAIATMGGFISIKDYFYDKRAIEIAKKEGYYEKVLDTQKTLRDLEEFEEKVFGPNLEEGSKDRMIREVRDHDGGYSEHK